MLSKNQNKGCEASCSAIVNNSASKFVVLKATVDIRVVVGKIHLVVPLVQNVLEKIMGITVVAGRVHLLVLPEEQVLEAAANILEVVGRNQLVDRLLEQVL